MKLKYIEPSVDFDYAQVDRDLGWEEPEERNRDTRAIDTFKRLVIWAQRKGKKNQGSLSQQRYLICLRLAVAGWVLQPSLIAGTSRKKLALEFGCGEAVVQEEADSLLTTLGIRSRRKQRSDKGYERTNTLAVPTSTANTQQQPTKEHNDSN